MKKHRPRRRHPPKKRHVGQPGIDRREIIERLLAECDDKHEDEEYEGALKCMDAALQQKPERFGVTVHVGVLFRRALALFRLGRFVEALIAIDRAISTAVVGGAPAPRDMAGAVRAEILYGLGRFSDGLAECSRASNPLSVESCITRTRMLAALGHDREAIEEYKKLLEKDDELVGHEVGYGFANLLLGIGDYGRGWDAWEDRLIGRAKKHWCLDPITPLADRSVAGRTVLIRNEMNLGDFFLFCRYVRALAGLGARVVLETPAPLVELMQGFCDGVDICAEGEIDGRPCEIEWPIASLPLVFATRLETIPNEVPYLTAPRSHIERWKNRLRCDGRKIVAISWTAGDQHTYNGQWRTLPLGMIEPILSVPGVRFVSIDRSSMGSDDLDRLQRQYDFVHVGHEVVNDPAGVAAIHSLADLVISADNTSGNLAGTLARPVWFMLSSMADWRWLRDRDDSPWYPTAKLFRQNTFGEWAPVTERVAVRLREMVEADC